MWWATDRSDHEQENVAHRLTLCSSVLDVSSQQRGFYHALRERVSLYGYGFGPDLGLMSKEERRFLRDCEWGHTRARRNSLQNVAQVA